MRFFPFSGLLGYCAVALAATKSKTFVVPHTDSADDAVAIRAALGNFTSDSTILFEKGVTYNIWTPLNFGTLNNVEIAIEGNITLPNSIPEVQGGGPVISTPHYALHNLLISTIYTALVASSVR